MSWCLACTYAGDYEHRDDCDVTSLEAFYWLGMLGFALAAPCAYSAGWRDAVAELNDTIAEMRETLRWSE